jgi:hypothetical protein
VHSVIAPLAPDARWVWTLTGGAFRGASPEAPGLYPGDDVVDHIGADEYNFAGFDPDGLGNCANHGGATQNWVLPATLIQPAVDFADAHGKTLYIPEWATNLGQSGSGNDAGVWEGQFADYVKAHPTIVNVTYFNHDDPTECNFNLHRDGSDRFDAFAAMAHDPWFGRSALAGAL